MKASFKQFSQFVDVNEQELTEEQLNEIFGAFFNKMDDLKRKRREEEIKKKLLAKKAELNAKQQELKNKQFAAAKAASDMSSFARKSRSEVHPMSAAGARAAERDWVSSMSSA